MRRRFVIWLSLVMLLVAVLGPAGARAEAPKVPLVLVHGLLGTPETTWGVAIPYFEQKGYVQGKSLFTVDLSQTDGAAADTGVLADAAVVAGEVRRILKETGAAQVDLMGKDRAGLIVRFLAAGETAPLVRRAVSLDAPHAGMMTEAEFDTQLAFAKVPKAMVEGFGKLLQPDSPVLTTMLAREKRFADRRSAAMAIASTWRDGHDKALMGFDGLASVSSQLAWPGARTFTSQIGPTPAELKSYIDTGMGIMALATSTPAVLAPEAEANLKAAYDFFAAVDVAAPARACEPNCQDWTKLATHWSAATVKPMLPDLLPYDLDEKGQREFDPNRPATRAEFAYALAKAVGLQEQLAVTKFADLHGHWALGYVEAAVAAKLVNGLSPESFGPDAQLTRAQAATLIVRARKLAPKEGPSRFADVARGHWAEANIEAAAEAGILKGDDRGFRPNDPVTLAEAAVILSRSFPR